METEVVKAFMVFSQDPEEGCLLIYAASHNKARSMAVGHLFEWDYIEMNCKRVPDFDVYADKVKHPVVESNEELPAGVKPFYTEPVYY